jgi:hypothetical protein
VPGGVHHDLEVVGLIPDPYVKEENKEKNRLNRVYCLM